MNPVGANDEAFLRKLKDIILENLECEGFGGKQLACSMGMSPSTLNRHIQKVYKKTTNQFIRETRLRQAMQLLHEQSGTVSEIAYKTGFGSPAYFNKCFHDYFGHTPGEVMKSDSIGHSPPLKNWVSGSPDYSSTSETVPRLSNNKRWQEALLLITIMILSVFLLYYFFFPLGRDPVSENEPELWHSIPVNSIAVLPPANLTGNPALEYFASGVHDALIGELGKNAELLVKSRTTTLPYQQGDKTAKQIAEEIGVNYIVESSVVGTDDSLHIRIQLIEIFPHERHIWSDLYSQDWSNVLFIYCDFGQQIANKIQLSLIPSEEKHLTESRNIHPELYKNYIRGVFHLNKLSEEGFDQGLKYLSEAIAIDPNEPLPYLGMAIAYSNSGHTSSDGIDAHLLAKDYALKALELDSNLAEAHAILATYYLYQEWEYEKAEHALSKAISLNPNIALAHYTNGWFQYLLGNDDTAVREMNRAIEISPLDPICTAYLGWLYLWMGDYDQATEQAKKTLEINPSYTMAYYVLGAALSKQGHYEEAIKAHLRGIEIHPNFLCGLGVTYAHCGKTQEALDIAIQLEKEVNAWNTWGLSDIYATLGDIDKAIYWVQKAYKLRQDFIPWMMKNPYYQPLYDEPDFIQIAKLVCPP